MAKEKNLLDIGRGEYLRLTYYEDGSVLGNLNRAICSLVNGNWETDV